MKKNKFNKVAGLTLIEVLISIAISTIMMFAMYTSYNLVNRTYSQVSGRAQISQSGRDVMGMITKDIRLAGFRYFGDTIPTSSSEHVPILITKSADVNSCCDQIDIVYGDYDINQPVNNRYSRYKITYNTDSSSSPNAEDLFQIYKSKIKWNNASNTWDPANAHSETYVGELVADYVEDFIFVPISESGLVIDPPPTNSNANSSLVYKIKGVEVLITFRSKEPFYAVARERTTPAIRSSLLRNIVRNDRFLRDSVVATVHPRNLGIQ